MELSKELIYPISIFYNDDYSLVLNENRTATLTKDGIADIIDLSILSKAALLSACINDKALLYKIIINVNNTNVYKTQIETLSKRIEELHEEFNESMAEQVTMLYELRMVY
ncbi:MAG: hypothetical protein WCS56_00335 [Bacilli bacterium]